MKDKSKEILLAVLQERFGDRVEKWQKQFAPRQLCIIVVEEKLAVLRPITAEEVAKYSMMASQGDIAGGARYVLQQLWLDGDNELLDDEDYFISAMMQVQNTIQLKESSFTTL